MTLPLISGLRVGKPAHGGACVARHEGRVVFVRHALPGELVDVQVTDASRDNLWRGDAVGVVEASPDRVTPPCPVAGSCGGCDFQHATGTAQRRMKSEVITEQLSRLAHLEWDVAVQPVDDEVLGWRTRMDYVAADGRVGLRAARSHELIDLPDDGCLIARPEIRDPRAFSLARERVRMVQAASGTSVIVDDRVEHGRAVVTERAAGRAYQVDADGFWQVHTRAAETLVGAVMRALDPQPGDTALDLYCGVGLFAGALVDAGATVTGVEVSRAAVRHAQANVPEARFITAPTHRAMRQVPARCDLVVLDPPRKGAGEQVCRAVASRQPRAIAYVACDPAALARDVGYFSRLGYVPSDVQAFDLFPMTHHVECVATLVPARHPDPTRSAHERQ